MSKKAVCDRCGKDDEMNFANDNQLPDNWHDLDGFDICSDCYADFEVWMGGAPKDEKS